MNLNAKIFNGGLAKNAVNECNGLLRPIIFGWDYSKNSTLMNPSIYNDNGVLRCNVRGTNYTLCHSEYGKFPHWAGPLQYIHPEHDVRLATENYIIDLDDNLEVTTARYVDMKLNVEPKWNFHGLEDCRVVKWEGKLYLSGVRRDTTTNGQGRMELSEIELTEDTAIEISRQRIPTETDEEYCEKNWMPIIDMPYHYIRFSNPLEIVKYDPITKSTSTVIRKEDKTKPDYIRGGSQVIRYKNYYLALGHSVKLWKPYSGEKDAEYWHEFLVWDTEFNLITITDPFKFINSGIEFSCGMCLDNNNQLVISFAESDNAPYLLRLDPKWLLSKILN